MSSAQALPLIAAAVAASITLVGTLTAAVLAFVGGLVATDHADRRRFKNDERVRAEQRTEADRIRREDREHRAADAILTDIVELESVFSINALAGGYGDRMPPREQYEPITSRIKSHLEALSSSALRDRISTALAVLGNASLPADLGGDRSYTVAKGAIGALRRAAGAFGRAESLGDEPALAEWQGQIREWFEARRAMEQRPRRAA